MTNSTTIAINGEPWFTDGSVSDYYKSGGYVYSYYWSKEYIVHDADEHNYAWAVDIPATTTTNGTEKRICECGASDGTREIPCISSVTLSASTYAYNGSVKSPSLTVKDANGKTLVKGTDYTFTTPSGRKNVGTYNYKVTFKGNYSGSKTVSFVINPATPSIKSVSVGKKKMTVKMTTKPSSKAGSGYQIYYMQKGTSTWKSTTTSSYYKTIKSLKKGKYYYVKVRAYKKVGTTTYYGAWSKTKLSKKIK